MFINAAILILSIDLSNIKQTLFVDFNQFTIVVIQRIPKLNCLSLPKTYFEYPRQFSNTSLLQKTYSNLKSLFHLNFAQEFCYKE